MVIAKKVFINFLVYIVIVAGTVFGLPRFLTWYLDTPYPMAAITSGSMWPALKEGDLIFIEGVSREQLAEDDIIVFRNSNGGTFTIHRIVSLEEDTLVTKGDANFNTDPPISYDDIIGRTVTIGKRNLHVPYLGSVTVFASNYRDF
jgi:signal peptidase I